MEVLPIQDEMQGKITAALAGCPLFRALKPEHLPQVVKLSELRSYSADEPIIRQGEASDAFFLLVEGRARITVDKAGEQAELGSVEAPSSLGEMGLLLREPRTATVAATSDALVLRFSVKSFEAMFQKIPEFGIGLAQGLATRLSKVSGRIALQEWDLATQGGPTPEALALLPLDLMQRHRALPLRVEGARLTIGLVDEPTAQLMNAIRAALPSFELVPVQIDAQAFGEALRASAGVPGWKAGAPAAVVAGPAPSSPRLDALLKRMVAEGASDVHLSAGVAPRWRIDGEISIIPETTPLGVEETLELLAPVMEKRHREQFAADNDVDFAYALPEVARFRVNMFRDHHGIGAVLRLIPSKILTLEQLRLPKVIKDMCELPKGLVLVTGTTGSGKSTTLAAMVDYINKLRAGHIITLEDPIEFVHTSQKCLVNQREVGGHTTSFSRALKACLREDPDIVLVGEMRDPETIALALETANTGHLVFGTLHTNSAMSAIDRVIDQFPADQQNQVRSVLADVLKGVVAQTLCKKKGGGRVAALEILVVNYAAAALIREAKTIQLSSVMQGGRGVGMQSLNDELQDLVEDRKLVEMPEALNKAVDKVEFARRFRSGVTLAEDPPTFERIRIMNVVADSPGAAAGLVRGEYILEAGGKAVKGMPLEEVRQMLRTDGKYSFTVERQGKRRSVTVELKRPF